jgi:hypothetical protein
MSENVLRLRERVPGNEKVTVNLGYVDLGRIDLLVREGFFSNRTDFIRTAIRNQLNRQSEEVSRSIGRHTLEVGLLELGSTILRLPGPPAKCCTSRWSGWSASPTTSRRDSR